MSFALKHSESGEGKFKTIVSSGLPDLFRGMFLLLLSLYELDLVYTTLYQLDLSL